MGTLLQRESENMADNRLAACLFSPKEVEVDDGAWAIPSDELEDPSKVFLISFLSFFDFF